MKGAQVKVREAEVASRTIRCSYQAYAGADLARGEERGEQYEEQGCAESEEELLAIIKRIMMHRGIY